MARAKRPRKRPRERYHSISESTLRQVFDVFADCLHARYNGKPPHHHDEIVEVIALIAREMKGHL